MEATNKTETKVTYLSQQEGAETHSKWLEEGESVDSILGVSMDRHCVCIDGRCLELLLGHSEAILIDSPVN